MEVPVHLEQVGVVHVGLELDLHHDLVLHFGLLYLKLVEYLDGADQLGLLLLSQVHAAEPTAAQFLAQPELVYFEVRIKHQAAALLLQGRGLLLSAYLLQQLEGLLLGFLIHGGLTYGLAEYLGKLDRTGDLQGLEASVLAVLQVNVPGGGSAHSQRIYCL